MVSVEAIVIFSEMHFDYTVSTPWVHLKDAEIEYCYGVFRCVFLDFEFVILHILKISLKLKANKFLECIKGLDVLSISL